MRKSTLIKALAFLLSFAMLMTGLPAPSIAESVDTVTDTVVEQTEDIVIEDVPVDDPEGLTEDDEDAVFPDDDTEADVTAGDDEVADTDPSEEIEEPADDEPVIEDDPDTELPVEPLPEEDPDDNDEPVVEDTLPEDEYQEEVEDVLEMPILRSAANPLRFNGTEAVRLGKESSNIGGIIVQKNGSSSTSIARHWVTVDGVEYTAFCIEAPKSSTSGRDGGLEPGSDAGLLWILNNVPDSSDEDYAIKQQAVWAYLGQSLTIDKLAAGSRCSMTTDQLRQRLTEIVANAQSASLSGSQELWIAYHLENRSYYQDMAFTVAELLPTATPTPMPVPTPTPTPVPVTGTIQVVKRDSATGAALTGAVFQLYDAAGYPVGAPVMTNGDGIVAWGNLPLGNYSVQEIAAPEGYNCDNGFYSLTLTENNLFLTVEVVNSVVYGKIRIIKTDADTQAVLAGAVFEVTDAYGAVVATLITGADGTAESDWLPYGSYTVTETQAASGYINSGFSTIVNVNEHGRTYTIDVENVSMQGGIRLTKTDADTGKPLSGVQFDIYDANGALVGSMTTNENGVAMSPNLPRGQYTVKEHALPTGYTGDLVVMTADVEPNAVTDLFATNTPITSRIKIIKTDAVTGEVLPGAVFSVTDDAGYTVATITTGADGTSITDWLPYGRYTVSEVQAPDRYINSGFSTTIYAEEDDKTYTITVENTPMQGGIRLTKTDSMTGTPIAGVEFGIYDMTGTLVASMTTDASGMATAPSLSKGAYIVREHGNPTGYVGVLAELSVEVVSEETTDLYVTNDPIQGRIRIVKKDAVTGDLLYGAEFSITRISGIPAHHGEGDGEIVATITTNTDGIAESPLLTYGTYRIEETAAPAGFLNSGFTADVMISEDNLQTIEVVVENERMAGGLRLTKMDSMTGTPIAGVQFDIYDANGTLVVSMTTDANGVAAAPSLTKGNYTVREHATPDGYVADLVELQAVVHSNETADLTATNTPIQGRIRIVKKDALTGDLLAGAEFSITRISGIPAHHGADDGEVVATITTDTNGVAESPLLTYGTYRIDETVAPTGYVNSGYSKEVSISGDNLQTIEVVVENEAMTGGLRLTKTDSQTGAPIEGVRFNIFQGDTLVATMTTDENGIATCDNLNRGTYIVEEDSLPEGYTGEMVVLEAVVQPDTVTELHATNTKSKSRIRIIKTDALTGERLPGAEFTVMDEVGNVFAAITDENGEVTTDWLPYGVYTVRETMTPEHYVSSDWSERIAAYENGMTYTFEVSNVPTNGYIRLAKTDSLNGMPISGVQFDIFDASGDLAGTMSTDDNGVAVSPALTKGSYTVREHENPTGYVAALAELPAVVYSDETTDLAVTNDPIQGKIRIVKKDQLTGDLLAGAEFTITRISGIPAHNGAGNGEVVAVITTTENGVVESPLLTYGTYKIEETVVPEHFVDNGFSVEVTISDDNLKTYVVVVENEPAKGWLKLTKTNSLDGHPIAGVTFNVYYYDDYGTGLACTMTTDENGVAVSPALRKGRYLVQEEDEPVGYVHDLAELTAIVTPDETTELSVTNEPIQGILRIRKLDELTGEALAGAEFTVTRISGLPSHNGEGDGEVVAVIATGANGIAVTPLLPYGVYQVAETKVPPHFVDNDFSTEMVINEENFCTYEIDVENEPTKGWLRLTKTDRENGNPIAGVVFDVYYADQYGQGLATTMVTDANGVAMSEPLRKGQYTVQERGATEGYVFEQVFLEATVHSDETTELTATNQPVLVQLKLYKRDVDEYSGNPADAPGTRGDGVLTGAEFQVLAAEDITDRQGNVVHVKGDVVVASIKTAGADASITTDKLWPGLYQVVELTPPTGYQPSVQPIVVDARDAAKQSEEAVITYEGVITNEIKYGAQAIVKLLGDGTAAADPTRVETPEPDAEFRVYLQKAGSYDNSRDIERDYLVTDANGYAMTKALPYGVYVLEQVKGKEGYEIKGPITFEIDGTESLVNPPPLTLSDQPILYRLRFIKTDSVTGKTITLSNASFKLKDANGEYVMQTVYYPREQVIDTFTTDDTGSVTLPETVTWGLYFVEEVKAPEGYLIRTDSLSVFVGHEGDLPGQTYELEIEIPNDPVMGRILLDKKGLQLTDVKITTDAWGNEVHTPVYEEDYLAGAVFEIRAAEDITGKAGTVWYQADELVDTIIATANGSDTSKELPLGKYNVTEVSAPEGYFFTDRAYIVDLKYQDNQTALVEVRVNAQNDFLPAEISLFKEKETINIVSSGKDGVKSVLTTDVGEGFVFGLFTAEDMPYAYGTLMADTLVATGATDKNGMLTLTGTFPHGDYYIRELAAPDGWKITAERFDLSITPDRKAADENVLRVLMVDAIHNELIHTKVTLTKTDITGAKTLPGAVIEVYNADGKIIYRDTTDEMGRIANIPVTPGRYTFREVYAPDGYSLNDVTMGFTVSADGVVTGDTTIRDDFTRFSIEKLDEADEPLAGVEFSLVSSNGVAIMSVRTDRNGIATFEKVPFGTYRIVEAKPLAGYLPAEMEVKVKIDGTFINPEHPIATIINVPNEIVIRKVDQDGKPLAGAVFRLFDAFGERFTVAASDENGMVCFTKVPYGSYTIRELSAPDGYLASREEIAVTIDADYRSTDKPIATVKNHFKRVQFIKVDTSGKYLPGVEFSLINAVTHEVVETAVSNDKGEFIFTKFDYGDWIIRETEAPEGYNRMEDYLLHVDDDWTEPKPITLVNIPSTYMFFKSDNKKNALAGATFAVEDENGNVVQEVVSAENGVVYIYGLTPGKYTIRETATVEGFTVSDDTITVEINEKYKVPTKLKRFVNYPGISTGVDISPTTMTWVGIGLVGIAGLIVVLNSVISGKKHPKRRRK